MAVELNAIEFYFVERDALTKLAENPPELPPSEFERFFPAEEWRKSCQEVAHALQSDERSDLSERDSCAFCNLAKCADSQTLWIDIPPEYAQDFPAWAARWLPILFGQPEAAQTLSRGYLHLRGSGRFVFGSFSKADLAAVPTPAAKTRPEGEPFPYEDVWEEDWRRQMTKIQKTWKNRSLEAMVVCAPHYVEILQEVATKPTRIARPKLPSAVSKDEAETIHGDAKKGKPEAQFLWGYLLSKGLGTKRNLKDAMQWYLKSAEQGYAPAQYRISVIYEEGQWVPQNSHEAERWYVKAADQGYHE